MRAAECRVIKGIEAKRSRMSNAAEGELDFKVIFATDLAGGRSIVIFGVERARVNVSEIG